MYRACPRTKGIFCSWQRSASQYHVLAVGGEGVEDGLGRSGDGEAGDDLSLGVEDAEGEGPGVEIDAAVESVLSVVEPHHGLRVEGCWSLVTSSMPETKRP